MVANEKNDCVGDKAFMYLLLESWVIDSGSKCHCAMMKTCLWISHSWIVHSE